MLENRRDVLAMSIHASTRLTSLCLSCLKYSLHSSWRLEHAETKNPFGMSNVHLVLCVCVSHVLLCPVQ